MLDLTCGGNPSAYSLEMDLITGNVLALDMDLRAKGRDESSLLYRTNAKPHTKEK